MEVINGVQGIRNSSSFGGKYKRNGIRVLNWGLGFLLFAKILLYCLLVVVLSRLEPRERERMERLYRAPGL